MANVAVTSDAWTEISITSGTIQNVSATAEIELSAEQTDNSGVVLKPSEIYQWDNETIYARAVTESAGALRVVNFKKATGGGGSYVLPVATASKLGGVKIGSNVSIDGNGVISVAAPYSLPTAAAGTLGGVKIGNNITIDDNGAISAPAAYTLPTAAANTLGGIKVGSNLVIDGNGVLSAVSGAGMAYSTTEQVVGSWIDGKPLYQKTYSCTTPSAINTYGAVISNLGNINVINITGYFIQNNVAHHVMVNTSFGSDYVATFANYDVSNNVVITMYTSVSAFVSCACYITLQYTKVTD